MILVIIIYYLKDFSLALGQIDRIPLILSIWAPVIALSFFTFIGVLQINENNFILLIFFYFLIQVLAENFKIQVKKITLDKDKQISIFKNDVILTTKKGKEIESDYAEYDKKN